MAKDKEEKTQDKILNIYQKMDMVRVEVGSIAKNIKVATSSNGGYQAVSESDVLKAVNEAEHKWGLISFQEALEIIESDKIERVLRDQKTLLFRIRVRSVVRIVNIDNPSEFVYFYGLGDGIDSQDKATGKANTYALKYALMRGYKIPTGEDPDYFSSKEIIKVEESKNEKKILESGLEKDLEAEMIDSALTDDDIYNKLEKEIKKYGKVEDAVKKWGFDNLRKLPKELVVEKLKNARNFAKNKKPKILKINKEEVEDDSI